MCKGEATLHIIKTPTKIQKIAKQCNIIIIIIIKRKLSHSLLLPFCLGSFFFPCKNQRKIPLFQYLLIILSYSFSSLTKEMVCNFYPPIWFRRPFMDAPYLF
jgi:hypothetical protein